MIVCGGRLGNGRELVIVGLDYENLDRLRAGKPARSDIDGLPVVLLHAAPTLRDVVEELVEHEWLPPSALDGYQAPATGEVRTWSPDGGHAVVAGDAPGDELPTDADAAVVRRRTRLREAVLDVIAPKRPELDGERSAVFEWAKETTPTSDELAELADEIAEAVDRVPS